MTEDIEQLIRRQPLREPTAALDARVRSALAEPATAAAANRWRLMLFPLGLAAAAAIALAVTINLRQTDAPRAPVAVQTPDQLAPAGEALIEISRSWTHSEPVDVLLVSESGGALRAVRQQQVQSTRWIDPTDGVAIEITVPVSEAQLVLQPAQVY